MSFACGVMCAQGVGNFLYLELRNLHKINETVNILDVELNKCDAIGCFDSDKWRFMDEF